MAQPRRLVPDSALVQDTIDLLRLRGGRAPVEHVAEHVLQLPGLDPPTAALLAAELIKDDWRLRLHPEHMVELTCADAEAAALAELDYVVVDVETTDARLPPGRVMEIGAYHVRAGRIVAEFQTLVNPETPIPAFIVGLTGINDRMVADAPRFADVAADWLAFADTAVLVAHNAAFDVRVLNHELALLYPGRRMANTQLCTVKLSRQLLPELSSHRLHNVAGHLSVPLRQHHRAPDDARATAEIFIRLLERLAGHGVHHLAAARRFRLKN